MEDYRLSLKEQNQETFLYLKDQDTGKREHFCIDAEQGRGASCIVYQAYLCKDGQKQRPVLLKEFYPVSFSPYLKREKDSHALCITDEIQGQELLSEIRAELEAEKEAFLEMCQKQNEIYLQNAKNSADEMIELQGIYTLGESFYVLMKAGSGCSWEQIEQESLFEILETTISILEEVKEIHKIGWLHGDIKPANIYIFKKTRQHVCLLDFGSMHKLSEGSLTGMETLSYSIQYAAPEVLEAEDMEGWDRIDYFSCITTKADLYSVAAVLYGKITGEYRDTNVSDKIFQKKLEEQLIQLWELEKHGWLKHVPATVMAELKLFFSVMLSLSPKRRYALEEMIERLRVILTHVQPTSLKLSQKYKPIHPTEHFIGRTQELELLKKYLNEHHQTICIIGEGGLGKSELALELAWRLKKKFDFYWVSFSVDLEQTILSMQTDPPFFSKEEWEANKENQKSDRKDLYRWNLKCLQGYGPTSVLIIDNFDVTAGQKYELLHSKAYADLMQLEMKVIFTSRERVIEQETDACVSLQALSNTELLELMCTYYNGVREEETMYQLIHMVERNTLLVKQIGKIMEQSWGELTPKKMLDAFLDTKVDFSPCERRTNKPPLQMHSAFGGGNGGSFEKIADADCEHLLYRQEQSPSFYASIYPYTKKLFQLSVLDETSKFLMAQTVLFPIEGIRANMYLKCHEEVERDKIRLLELSGWIKKTSNNQLLVHSLIREVCKRELPQKEESCKVFLNAYDKEYQKLSPQDWMEQRFQRMEITMHAADCLEDIDGVYAELAGDRSYQEGRYVQALEYYQKFWERFMATHQTPDSLEAMRAIDKVANSAYSAGNLQNAIYYEASGLQIAERELGEDCAKLFPYYINLGNMYQTYGAYSDAAICYQKALELYEKHGLTDTFQKAVLYMYCAKLCEKTKEYEKAWRFGVLSMELYKKCKDIPPIYPASMFVTFGILCYHHAKYPAAVSYYEEAIKIYETVLGKEHPTLAGCYQNRGISFTALQQYEEAWESFETARKIQEEVLGICHPSTANTYHSISMLYYAKKEYQIAKVWCDKAKEIREKLYGRNSFITNKSLILEEAILNRIENE